MSLLIYSDKCKYSGEILKFIAAHEALKAIVRFHNVTTRGVPSKKITRVPTLVTNEGKMCVGAEVKEWLVSMIPCEFESWDSCTHMAMNLDGSENGGHFDLDRYGQSLQPAMTPELESRIAASVNDAYQQAQSK